MGETQFDSFGHGAVEANRRLTNAEQGGPDGIAEYYDAQLTSWVLALPAHGTDAQIHSKLVEQRLPVFSAIYGQTEVQLLIPGSTRPLAKMLHLIARDIASYSDIFQQLGRDLGSMQKAGFGVPSRSEYGGLLASFAFSQEEEELYGGKLYLLPPYALLPSQTIEGALSNMYGELRSAGSFTDMQISELVAKTHRGWRDGIQ